jgi:hypothetical protein
VQFTPIYEERLDFQRLTRGTILIIQPTWLSAPPANQCQSAELYEVADRDKASQGFVMWEVRFVEETPWLLPCAGRAALTLPLLILFSKAS